MEQEKFEVNLDIEDEEMTEQTLTSASKRKGRGFTTQSRREKESYKYDSVSGGGSKSSCQKSVEGWIILVTGIHEEASEEDVSELFADFGQVVNIHLNLNRRTGFVKVIVLIMTLRDMRCWSMQTLIVLRKQ